MPAINTTHRGNEPTSITESDDPDYVPYVLNLLWRSHRWLLDQEWKHSWRPLSMRSIIKDN
ncbi:hypothetical protein A2U01_0101348, partial [Trifolium medium]|nr:hypothetical protein [Trifolium medium]